MNWLIFVSSIVLWVSDAITADQARAEDLLADSAAYFAAKISLLSCGPAHLDFPRWRGFPVRECTYRDTGVVVKTFMLNPSAEQLAAWTLTACQDAHASSPPDCVRTLQQEIS